MNEHRQGGAPIPPKPNQKDDAKAGDQNADWGLSGEKMTMSRETKIGLTLVVVLVLAFGFVVFRKIQNRDDIFTEEDNAGGPSSVASKSHSHPHSRKSMPILPAYDGRKKPAPFPVANSTNNTPTGLFGQQQEPDSGHGHRPQENPFARNRTSTPIGHVHDPLFDADRVAETSISGMTWVFTHPPPLPAAPEPKVEPQWELGGGSATTTVSNTPTPNGDPFATTGNSGGTPSFENTPGLNDGFRNADSAGSGKVQVFPAGHRSATSGHDFHDHGQPAGTMELFPSGNATAGKSDQFQSHSQHQPDVNQTSPIGSDTHRKRGFRPAPKPDSRLGAFEVTGSRDTQVRGAGGSNDLNYPFGRPTGTSTGQNPDVPIGRRPFRPAPRPGQTLDEHRYESPQPVEPVDYTADRPQVHTVQHGENYWSISRKAYGAGKYFQALAAYNSYRIPDPRKMRPGMKVLIPPIDALAKRHPKLCPGYAATQPGQVGGNNRRSAGFFRGPGGHPMYRVGKTDTLSDIAQKHLGRASRWIQVYRMNERRITNPNRLKIGTELILPADASRVSMVKSRTRFR